MFDNHWIEIISIRTLLFFMIGDCLEDTSFEISIPCDDDGFVLLQCPHCGELFKLAVEDIESDGIFTIYCPSCGLAGDSFLTDDVIDLALAKSANLAFDAIAQELQSFSKRGKESLIQLKVKSSCTKEPEQPIRAAIEALQIATCQDCLSQSKISPALIMSAYTCPLCGIGQLNEQ